MGGSMKGDPSSRMSFQPNDNQWFPRVGEPLSSH